MGVGEEEERHGAVDVIPGGLCEYSLSAVR